MTTTDHVPSLRGWTPTRFFRGGDGEPRVEWCQLGELRLNAPFFMQTEQTARARGLPTRQTSADVLLEFAAHGPDLPLAGLIFHLSRCGSTLVSQMLAALPANVVLSEADPVDDVLRAEGWSPPASEERRIGWLRGLAHAYGARRFSEERRLFIKFEPWHVLDLASIRAALPGVPWIYLYRDPVEILVSQSEHLARTMFCEMRGPARIGLTPAETSRLSADEYCARALGRMARTAADSVPGDPRARLVAYPELPAAVETVIAPWFDSPLEAEDRARMAEVARFHAKAPGKVIFAADSARKQREADDDVRGLAERWIGEEYARLETVRSMQVRGE